jgi:DNA-binding NtrC family response regulator
MIPGESMDGGDTTRSLDRSRVSVRGYGARLLVLDESTSSMINLPARAVLLVGRAPDADVRLSHNSVSRHHARIFVEDEGVRIADLESHNGVLINGERVQGARVLAPSDVVFIGEATLVLYAADGHHGERPPLDGAATELLVGDRTVLLADPAMARLYDLVRRLAASDLSVLVLGETGAGKENVASAVHCWSRRKGGPFVAINCAAIAESLVESELFGHEKAAFTGATAVKIGLLESAAGGTVFLDEVGELPSAVQAKLLRAIETRRILRVGGVKEREIDIRLVAATHRHLEREVEVGRFRKDLFFRLGVATVVLPPLRDRLGEVALLAQRFLAAACATQERAEMALSPATQAVLRRYPWPGNVRELPAQVEAAATATTPRPQVNGTATSTAPVEAPAAVDLRGDLERQLKAIERKRIIDALTECAGNQKCTAEKLGISLRTLVHRLDEHAIPRPRKRK